jgi:hypothetical protein
MNLDQLLELFFAIKADKSDYCFDLAKNYHKLFYQMICEYQKLSDESKENFGVLENISNTIEQKIKSKQVIDKKYLAEMMFKKGVTSLLKDNRYKIISNNETRDYTVYANSEYIEDVIKNSTHKERIDVKEIIWFFDKIDMIVNDKVLDVKRK